MKKKTIYVTYDDKRFENLAEGFAYDMAALRSIAEELWFIGINGEFEGFNSIPINHYEGLISSFTHAADLEMIMQLFIKCPIVYCATDRAAEIFTKILRKPRQKILLEGLAKGINYWFEGDDRYYHEDYFIDKFEESTLVQFCRLRKTIEDFIENNGIAAEQNI